MQIEVPIMKVSLQQRVSEAKEAQQNGALLLTKFSKVRSNSLNSSRLLYLAAWIVSRIFASILCGHPGFVKAVDQHG